jgi:hypothetical protein
MTQGTTYRTQRVTAVDLAQGRIRIPIGQKDPFPAIRDRVTVVLCGRTMDVAFDPRLGPDRERSGVLYIGRVLAELVSANEVLEVKSNGDQLTIGQPRP